MQDERYPHIKGAQGYVLPPNAFDALTCTRDHLRLLAQLTESHGESVTDVVYLSAEALARCFDRLADDLDQIAKAGIPAMR